MKEITTTEAPAPITYLKEITTTEAPASITYVKEITTTEAPESVIFVADTFQTTQAPAESAEIVLTEAPIQYEPPKTKVHSPVYFASKPKVDDPVQITYEEAPKVEIQSVYFPAVHYEKPPAKIEDVPAQNKIEEVEVPASSKTDDSKNYQSTKEDESFSEAPVVPVYVPVEVPTKNEVASASSTNSDFYSVSSEAPQVEVPAQVNKEYSAAGSSSSTGSYSGSSEAPKAPVEVPAKVNKEYSAAGPSSSTGSYSGPSKAPAVPAVYKKPFTYFQKNPYVPRYASGNGPTGIFGENSWRLKTGIPAAAVEEAIADTSDAKKRATVSEVKATEPETITEVKVEPVVESIAVPVVVASAPAEVPPIEISPLIDDGPDAASIIASAIDGSDTDAVEIEAKDGRLETSDVESAVADAADVEEKEVGPVDVVEIIDLTGVAPEDIPADVQVFEVVNLQGVAPHDIPHDVIPVELFPVDISGTVQTSAATVPVATGTVEASAGVSTSSAAGESSSASASAASDTVSVSTATSSGATTVDDGPDAASIIASAIDAADTDPVEIEAKDGRLETSEVESAVADAADVKEKEVGPVDVVEIIDLTGVAPEDIPADVQVFEVVNLQGVAPHDIPHDVIPVELFPVDISGTVQTSAATVPVATGTVEASAGVSTSSAAGESSSASASAASETGGVAIAESASISSSADSGSVAIVEPAKTEATDAEPAKPVVVTKAYGTETAKYQAPEAIEAPVAVAVEAPLVVETVKADYPAEPVAAKANYYKSAGYSQKSDGKGGKSAGSSEAEGGQGSKEAEGDEE